MSIQPSFDDLYHILTSPAHWFSKLSQTVSGPCFDSEVKMADTAGTPMELESPASREEPLKDGFYKAELNKTVWEVPVSYQELTPIGTGAYGSVW